MLNEMAITNKEYIKSFFWNLEKIIDTVKSKNIILYNELIFCLINLQIPEVIENKIIIKILLLLLSFELIIFNAI